MKPRVVRFPTRGATRAETIRRTVLFLILALILTAIYAVQSGHSLLPPLSIPLQAREAPPPPPPPAWEACGGDAACCARHLSPAAQPHVVADARMAVPAALGGGEIAWRMATHSGTDIVSYWVKRTGTWDITKSTLVLNALHAKSGGGGAAARDAVLLDVGANIGWFTLAAATAGFRVVAVEPFAENLALVRHSLCLAPAATRARVTLLPFALGADDGATCELWQNEHYNRGDTFTVCDAAPAAPAAQAMRGEKFRKLGVAHLRRLDSMVRSGEAPFPRGAAVVVKIDVEGFEPFALRGGIDFINARKPHVIFSEYSPKMISSAAQSMGASAEEAQTRPKQFLDWMEQVGYSHAIVGTGTDPFWGPIHEVNFKRK